MFGTLNIAHDVRQQTPLRFVENRDLSSALSRNSRERPHISCEFCRSRKVRCSGQPSGCNRCQAVGAACRYPPREPRRKTALGARKTGEKPPLRTGTGDDKIVGGGQFLQSVSDPRLTCGDELIPNQGGTSSESASLTSAVGPHILDQEMDNDYWYRDFGDHDLVTPVSLQFGEEEGSKDRLDEWLDTNDILETRLPSISGGPNKARQFDSKMLQFSPMNDDGYANYFNSLNHDAALISTPTTPDLANFADHGTISETRTSSTALLGARTERSQTSGNGSNHRQTLTQLSPIYSTPSSLHPAAHLTGKDSQPSKISDLSMASGSCGCLQLAACLLEELGAKSAAGDRVRMDVLLGDFREALTHCTDILDCGRCVEAREINMLLAMSIKYMSTMCEHLAVCYAELKQTQGLPKSNGLAGDFRFSTYEIEHHKEQLQVLGGLVTVQIEDFTEIIGRLKMRLGIRRGHLMLLTEARNKVSALQVLLSGGQGSSLGGGMDGMY
ncbi:hypothetical protein QBC36DRAFT_385533 [Triangularia setosa]|uniref:Zn(2)-C6 fungal-type domain-containing protein n=1 Tax=Triangularia setosa TaxID=2587417 RepID=A0AAN7A875_9PEZI|nr:hypothetical protein QBC36DRAFT_385533 [Podospora setosa]